MILVNDNWEQVNDLSDALKIIEDNLGREFAEKFVDILIDELAEQGESIYSKTMNLLYNYIGIY